MCLKPFIKRNFRACTNLWPPLFSPGSSELQRVQFLYLPLDYRDLPTVDRSPAEGTLNNSVVVVGGSLRSCWWCWWFSGGHVVLTAGEAEIRDGLGGTEGGGHLESGRSQFKKEKKEAFLN